MKERKPNIGVFGISEERIETLEEQYLKKIAENF